MKITAATTDDQILASITVAKQKLSEVAAEAASSEELVNAAQAVRNAEELARVQLQYRNHLAHEASDLQIMKFLLNATRVDNDSTRAAADVVRTWADSIAENLV